MQHHEDFFVGRGGKKIYRQWWLPNSEPVATVVVVHGLAEHSGRYDTLVHHLVPLGYAVYGFDHLGHGRSEGHRCHAESLADFTDNLQRMVLWVKEQQQDKKLFLLGHSMGGLITGNYLIDHQEEVDGAILSAPAVMSPFKPTFSQKIKVGLLHKVFPRASFRKVDPAGISRDPDVVESYREDPLVYTGAMSIGLALVMGSAMGRLREQATQITLPLLIVQGGHDLLVKPKGAKALYDWVQSKDKQLKIYPDSYHEIMHEPEAPQALTLIEAWLRGERPKESHWD